MNFAIGILSVGLIISCTGRLIADILAIKERHERESAESTSQTPSA